MKFPELLPKKDKWVWFSIESLFTLIMLVYAALILHIMGVL